LTEESIIAPECLYQGSMVLKAFRFPIKDFGDDGKRRAQQALYARLCFLVLSSLKFFPPPRLTITTGFTELYNKFSLLVRILKVSKW